MSNQELLIERQNRILAAMRGEKIDRTPLMLAGDMGPARTIDPTIDFEVLCNDHQRVTDAVLDHFMPLHPNVDMFEAAGSNPRNNGAIYITKTLLPGKDLEPDQMYQFVFDHFMTMEDYDDIIDNGWEQFRRRHVFGRLGYDEEEMAVVGAQNAKEIAMYHDAGIPFKFGGMMGMPFDALCFCRGTEFYIDMLEEPEKVMAAMEVILEEDIAAQAKVIPQKLAEHKARGEELMYCVAPCVQANCSLVGREQFEEFGWPLIKRQTDFLIDQGCYVRFHMDANWTNNLDLFATFPKGRCIFDSDGNTDFETMREVLGPVMAFTGSVEPATLAFGTPEAVYKEVRDQIETMGNSFIASSACTIPVNAPAENIEALYQAVCD